MIDTDTAPIALHGMPAPLTPRERILEHHRAMREWAAQFGEEDGETAEAGDVESPEDRAARDERVDIVPS